MDDEVRLRDGLPLAEEELPDAHLPHPEVRGELRQCRRVGAAVQGGEFREGPGDALDVVRAVLLELHPAPADAQLQWLVHSAPTSAGAAALSGGLSGTVTCPPHTWFGAWSGIRGWSAATGGRGRGHGWCGGCRGDG